MVLSGGAHPATRLVGPRRQAPAWAFPVAGDCAVVPGGGPSALSPGWVVVRWVCRPGGPRCCRWAVGFGRHLVAARGSWPARCTPPPSSCGWSVRGLHGRPGSSPARPAPGSGPDGPLVCPPSGHRLPPWPSIGGSRPACPPRRMRRPGPVGPGPTSATPGSAPLRCPLPCTRRTGTASLPASLPAACTAVSFWCPGSAGPVAWVACTRMPRPPAPARLRLGASRAAWTGRLVRVRLGVPRWPTAAGRGALGSSPRWDP